MKIEWSPAARASARRYLADQDGMRAIGGAIAQLGGNPYPPEAFHRGDYHRLRVGPYRAWRRGCRTVRWMTEGRRVSLIAQTVGIPVPVSGQRIQTDLDQPTT